MRKFLEFMKTTAIGGLLVIVPISIILFVLAKLAFGLYSIAESVLRKFSIAAADAVVIFGVTALSLIGLCFLMGLLVRTRLGQYLNGWFGRHVGRRIPMYNAIANMTRRFAGVEGHDFAPVEVDLYNSDTRHLGFLIEELPDQRCVVFVPSAPVATVGNVCIIARARVATIDSSVADTLTAITQWGVDTRKLFVPKKTGTDGDAASG